MSNDLREKNTGSGVVGGVNTILVSVGKSVGGIVGVLYQAGRDTIETIIRKDRKSVV